MRLKNKMDMSDVLEEYRKIKLKEELDKALYNSHKYTIINIEITYEKFKNYYLQLPVNKERFQEFIDKELEEYIKERKDIDRDKSN